jgi:ATP-binding protein involved in chromosome partitioning
MFGLSKSKSEFDLEAKRLPLMEAFSDIMVEEFSQDVVSLDLIRNIEMKNGKLAIDLVLPTFALRSEQTLALAVQKAAAKVVTQVEIELNVYADVKPATTKSLFKENIADVKNIILVASGKGGVGKSTVASNLAVALARLGCRVGLLDADVYGPSVPMMLGVAPDTEVQGISTGEPSETFMLPIERHGIKLMSIGFLVDTSSAMIWRGPMIASASMQMFYNVAWGDLDYLVVDMPPGTGDIQLTIAQRVAIAGSVIVSTPQDVALADVVRAKAMFDKVSIPSLGVVENMSYFVCDGCDKRHEIFTHGGAQKAAERLGLPFLGEVPIEIKVRQGGDEGKPIAAEQELSASGQAFKELAHEVATRIAQNAILSPASQNEGPTISITGISKTGKKGLPVLS